MQDTFRKVTLWIIDNLEGGYYHPDMMKRNPEKFPRYENSGETMFGIDRRQGGSINTSPAGVKFWGLIDKANARTLWKWNYKGGELADELKPLVVEMMYPRFIDFLNRYIPNKALQSEIFNNPVLLGHFIYATWNGSGWFQRFAKNAAKNYAQGARGEALKNLELGYRANYPNSLIAQGGKKIIKLQNTI